LTSCLKLLNLNVTKNRIPSWC